MKALLALMMAGKLGKVLFSAGSMLLSVAIYAQLFGWRYAAGFVLLLLVHEMGHYIAARQRGLDVGLPTFIPFVGAWINLKNQKLDPETAAFVGMAGPLLGSTGAFVVYLAALQYQLAWLLAIALAALFLWRPSPLLIVVAILAVPRAWAAFRNKLPVPPESLLATRTLKVRYAAEYLGLVCFLTLAAFEVHSQLPR